MHDEPPQVEAEFQEGRLGKRSPRTVNRATRWLETVCNPGTPRPEFNGYPILAGLLAHRSSSLAQPSQPFWPVACGGRDSLFTVAGAALELALAKAPHQIPYFIPSGQTSSGT